MRRALALAAVLLAGPAAADPDAIADGEEMLDLLEFLGSLEDSAEDFGEFLDSVPPPAPAAEDPAAAAEGETRS